MFLNVFDLGLIYKLIGWLQLYEGLIEKLPAYARPIFVRLVNKIDVTGEQMDHNHLYIQRKQDSENIADDKLLRRTICSHLQTEEKRPPE